MSATLHLLSVQSGVTYGHVGNSAAVFPLQRLGVEVWPVNTVQFSNHTGYGTWRGALIELETVQEILLGVEERGAFPRCDGVLSGYLGGYELGDTILETLGRIRSIRPDCAYCCDPVMGDVGRGFFVKPGIPEFFRDRALAKADLITPNQFELEYLTGRRVTDLRSAVDAARALLDQGPQVVLVTSLDRLECAGQAIEVLAVSRDQNYLLATPRLDLEVNGAGDVTAALFFVHWLKSRSVQLALEKTVNSVFSILELTAAENQREIQLVAGQEAIAHPPSRFRAERI